MAEIKEHDRNSVEEVAVSFAGGNNQKNDIQNPSRRNFIKKAVVGGIAVASAAGAAKKIAKWAEDDAANRASLNDNIQQDRIIAQKKYVLMTKKEKERMVKIFVNSYKEQV